MNTETITTITIYVLQYTGKHGSDSENIITTTLPEGLREITEKDEFYLDECYAFSGGPTFVYRKQLTMAELAEGITLHDMREEIIGIIGESYQ